MKMTTTTIVTQQPSDGDAVRQLAGGIVLRAGNLEIPEAATEEELKCAFAKVTKMDGKIAWWIGDLGLALQDRKRRQLEEEAAELRNRANGCSTDKDGMQLKSDLLARAEKLETRGVTEYARTLSEMYGVEYDRIRGCVMVARFWQPWSRDYSLSFKHHKTAMLAAGGAGAKIETATEWLKRAKNLGLTVQKLRKVANTEKAVYADPEPDPEPLSYDDLIAADHWAVAHKGEIKSMSIEQALRVYTLIQGIREYVDELRRRLQPGG